MIATSPERLARWLVLAAALLAAGCAPEEPRFRSTDITGADFGTSLSLRDTTGRVRSLEDFRGKTIVLFFGFTQCPDVCPTTLTHIASALKQLGADAARVQVLFVSLDPERDTPQLLAQYVDAFGPGIIALHGTLEETRRAAQEFKVFFEKRPASGPARYTVDHSSQSYVLDAEGRLRLFVRHERTAEDLAPDLRSLLAETARR